MIRKSAFAQFLAFLVLLVAAPAAAQVTNDADVSVIDSLARSDLAASSRTSALVAGVLYDGDIDFLGAWGTPAAGSDEELNSQYLFAWPALTEIMLATTVRALHDAGQLDAFQPLGQLIPDLPGWLQTVSLDQLLTHRAGLSDLAPTEGMTWDGLIEELPANVRMAPPGSVFSWSRWSYPIAGRMMEILVNARVADIAQFAIIAPLGMTRTSFDPRFAEAGGLAEGSPAAEQEPWDLPPVYTTASDVLQFAAAWMGGAIRGTTPGSWAPEFELRGATFADGVWMDQYESMGRFRREDADLGFSTALELFRYLDGTGVDARGSNARAISPNAALMFWGNGAGPRALKSAVENEIYFNLGIIGQQPNSGVRPATMDASWVGEFMNAGSRLTIAEGPQGLVLVRDGRTLPLLRQPDGSYLAGASNAAGEAMVLVPRILSSERVLYFDQRAHLSR